MVKLKKKFVIAKEVTVSGLSSVTRIKLPNGYKSCPKMISLEK